MGNDRKRKHFLHQKRKHSNKKETYTGGSKSTGRKVGFAAVFADITRRETTRRSLHPHS